MCHRKTHHPWGALDNPKSIPKNPGEFGVSETVDGRNPAPPGM